MRKEKARRSGPSCGAWLALRGRSCAPAFEALDPAAAIDGSFPAGVGGMALRADLDLDRGRCRSCLEGRSAVGAADRSGRQLRMDVSFHRSFLRCEWQVVLGRSEE